MAKVIIDKWGTKQYFNDIGQWHREDGPALISRTGTKWWYKNDNLSSEEYPSAIVLNGIAEWRINHHLNNKNGPAYDKPNGHKEWKFGLGCVEWPRL